MSIVASEPYRCPIVGDDDLVSQFGVPMTCLKDGPQWGQLGLQFAWSCVVWLLVYFASCLAEPCWQGMLHSEGMGNCPPAWVQQWVGTSFRNPKDQRLEILLEFCQLCASTTNIFLWIKKSYTLRGSTDIEFAVELLCVMLNICHAIFGHIRAGFDSDYCFTTPVFIDSFTLSPIILQRAPSGIFGGSWLTLVYLRAYQQLTAFKHLCSLGMFERSLSDFTQAAIITALECVLVVYTIAGTIWILEGLGDIENFTDQFMPSGMGGISFFQMIYFAFMTISTVGFGDYSPTTVLSRAFTILATITGVTYFSLASVQIIALKEIEASGLGRFRPSKLRKYKDGRGHILVIGGGVACGSATVLETFLRALCRGDNTPEIVLMSENPCSKEVKALLRQEWTTPFKIHYFVGAPLDRNDMERVRVDLCSQIFVITDFQTADSPTEDRRNLVYAMHVQRALPDTEFRIMLNTMPSLDLATQIGLNVVAGYSIEALKASLLATSLRCPGFSTLVLNLGLPDLPDPDHTYGTFGWNEARTGGGRLSATLDNGGDVSPWLREYVAGCGLEPYGFLPAPKYVGKTFTEAAVAIAEENLVLVAAQIDGAIRLNPTRAVVTEGTVLFAIAGDSGDCDAVARDGVADVSSWINTFDGSYHRGGFKARQRRKSTPAPVAAARKVNPRASWRQAGHGVRRALSTNAMAAAEAHDRRPPAPPSPDHESVAAAAVAGAGAGVTGGGGGGGGRRRAVGGGRSIELVGSDVTASIDRVLSMDKSPPAAAAAPNGFPSSSTHTHDAELREAYEQKLPDGAEAGLFPPGFPLTPTRRAQHKDQRPVLASSASHSSLTFSESDFLSMSAYANAGGTPTIGDDDDDGVEGEEPHAVVGASFTSGGFLEGSSHGASVGAGHVSPGDCDCGLDGSCGGGGGARSQTLSSSPGASKRVRRGLPEAVALGEFAEKIVSRGGHIVIVLCTPSGGSEVEMQSLWHQLDLIVDVLRSTWGSSAPVIVVNSRESQRYETKLLEEAEACGARLGFIIGDPLNPSVLVAAGVHTCLRLLTLVPSTPSSAQAQDVGNLMLVMLLEQLVYKGRHADIPSVFDWYSPRSVALLPLPPSPGLDDDDDDGSISDDTSSGVGPSDGIGRAAERGETKSTASGERVPPPPSAVVCVNPLTRPTSQLRESHHSSSMFKISKFWSSVSDKDRRGALGADGGLSAGDVAYAHQEPRCHYRFAAGRVLPKPHIAAMFSMAYYTPGVLELLESLINPAKYDQTSLAWAVNVPPRHVGKEYSVIALELLRSSAVPMGLLRSPILGEGTPLPYVVALTPKSHLKLRKGDSVFALADRAWAADHGVTAAVQAQAAALLLPRPSAERQR